LKSKGLFGLRTLPNQLVVETVKSAQFEEQLHFQLELDEDEEYLRELDALKAMQLAKRASKRNQQATQAGQQRISEECNKYLKQVAELPNLTLVGHLAVAGRPIITGHPSVAIQLLVVRQPTLQSWEDTRR
jgi:hypothetical protein